MDSLVDTGSITLAAAIGVLLMPVASLLKSKHWSVQAKYFLAIVVSFAAAAVTVLVNGSTGTGSSTFNFSHDWTGVVALFGASSTAAQSVYKLWFANTVTEQKLSDTKVL